MAFGFGLQIQLLPRDNDKVLVLGHVAGLRSESGWFGVSDVASLFKDLRLSPPANISACLGRLRKQDLVTRRVGDRPWSLTPLGQHAIEDLIGDLEVHQIQVAHDQSPGAELAHVRHPVIPPELAPPRWLPGIRRLLEAFPFETNVFCMTRFPPKRTSELPDILSASIDTLKESLAAHGLNLHLASDRQIDDELIGNVGAYMWACQYGIGILEDRDGRGLNYNVAIELGSMLITGRRCAMLKDVTAPVLPTDFAGHIYKTVDLDDPSSIAEQAHLWAAEDLGLGRCASCPKNRPS